MLTRALEEVAFVSVIDADGMKQKIFPSQSNRFWVSCVVLRVCVCVCGRYFFGRLSCALSLFAKCYPCAPRWCGLVKKDIYLVNMVVIWFSGIKPLFEIARGSRCASDNANWIGSAIFSRSVLIVLLYISIYDSRSDRTYLIVEVVVRLLVLSTEVPRNKNCTNIPSYSGNQFV